MVRQVPRHRATELPPGMGSSSVTSHGSMQKFSTRDLVMPEQGLFSGRVKDFRARECTGCSARREGFGSFVERPALSAPGCSSARPFRFA
eukprot:5026684-Pyramimonas_sp.AAC.1